MKDDPKQVRVTVTARESVSDSFLYLTQADQFLLAARKLSGESANKADPLGDSGWPMVADAITYLFCHSMELYLKAFLSEKGMTAAVLKSAEIRHNLVNLEREAVKRGLKIPPTVSQMIAALSHLHSGESGFRLRYPKTSSYELRLPFRMNEAATLLSAAVHKKG